MWILRRLARSIISKSVPQPYVSMWWVVTYLETAFCWSWAFLTGSWISAHGHVKKVGSAEFIRERFWRRYCNMAWWTAMWFPSVPVISFEIAQKRQLPSSRTLSQMCGAISSQHASLTQAGVERLLRTLLWLYAIRSFHSVGSGRSIFSPSCW